MAEPESNANVALAEEAASTSAESLTATEDASAEKSGELKTAETQPDKGKSSQQTPLADESEEKDPPKGKDVPYGQYLRMKESREKARTQLASLEELGIKSKEDAEFLLKDVETVKEEAHKQGQNALENWITENPATFYGEFRKEEPEATSKLQAAMAPDILQLVANGIQQSDPEIAEKLRELAAKGFVVTGNGSGNRAPKDSENEAIKREKLSIQEERQKIFDEQAKAEFTPLFRSKFDELTKGLAFSSDKQKARLYSSVYSGVSDSLDRNPVFIRQFERLIDIRGLSKSEVQDRRKQLVDLHTKYATDPTLLKRLIEEEKSVLGLTLQQKASAKEARGEVDGSGTPPVGKLTADAKDRKYAELQGKYDGRLLAVKWAEWLHSNAGPGA